MIILQYGMQGSASSWAFRLLTQIAENLGSKQSTLLKNIDSALAWNQLSGAKYVQHSKDDKKPWDINVCVEKTPENRILILKTHSDLPASVSPLLLSGDVKAVVTIRDPIDCAWSIYNKGKKARMKGTQPFSHITSVEHALKVVYSDYKRARTWLLHSGSFALPFEFVASEPLASMRAMSSFCGMQVDDDFLISLQDFQPANFSQGKTGEGHKNIDRSHIQDFYKKIVDLF